MNILKERRFKIASVSIGAIVEFLNWFARPQKGIALPQIEQLPDDVVVLTVHSNHERGTMDFLLVSQQFDPVPIGQDPERLPDIGTEWKYVPFAELAS